MKQDPNAIATIEAQPVPLIDKGKPDDTFTTKRGVKLRLKAVDPLIIKKAQDRIKLPPRPTYQTVTFGGKKEEFPLDAVSADQVPNGKSRWLSYLEDRNQAFSEKNDAVMRTTFYYGVEFVDPMPTDWMEEHEALGMEVPMHENPTIQDGLRKAHYLVTHLTQHEVGDLLTKIMKLSGVSEEDIQAAEDAFRG